MDSGEINFGHFRLDLRRRELWRDGETIRLHAHAIGILCELAAARGEVVSKDELISRLWPGRIVEEGNLHVHISALRKALGGHGEGHSYIVTVPGRGYRLATGWPSVRLAEPSFPTSLPLPDKPSIAVLPFENMSGDPEQEYFADGMVEEVITALSRIRWLFVIARNSTSTYKGQPIDLRRIGRELGVSYVLEGSVRRSGGQVRIAAQLIEAESGTHLWADHFDGSLEEVFELQDRVAISVAGAIEPTLEAAEVRRSVHRPTTDLTAYELYLRAHAIGMTWEKGQVFRQLDLLEQAITRDPDYALALAEAAFCRFTLDLNDWTDDRVRNREESLDLAARALRLGSDDAIVLGDVASVLGYFEREIRPAVSLMHRALELNPSHAVGWSRSGWLLLWAGQPDIAIEHFEKSLRLNPRRKAPASFGIAVGHFFARRLDAAVAMLQLSVKEYPNWAPCQRILAACYAHLGRLDDARKVIKKLGQITSVLIPNMEHFRVPEQRGFVLEGLRIAAGETETK